MSMENESLFSDGKELVPTPDMTQFQQQDYPWSESQKCLIYSHINYHCDMSNRLQHVLKNGPTGIILPKEPNPKISTLFGNAKRSKILVGAELHNYLAACIVSPETPLIPCAKLSQLISVSLETIVPYLQSGYQALSKNCAQNTEAHFEYGKYLNCAFELHQRAKWDGTVTVTWENWLKTHVAISSISYVRKLREIAKLFGDYSKMNYLAMSFSEIYQRRRQIENMFATSQEIKTFWK
jgi:hypothetical protein